MSEKQAYTPRELGGNLFKNTFKEEGSNQPDYRGECCINGQVFKIAAWIKDASNGTKFMSMSYEPKDEIAAVPAPVKPQAAVSDDIPF